MLGKEDYLIFGNLAIFGMGLGVMSRGLGVMVPCGNGAFELWVHGGHCVMGPCGHKALGSQGFWVTRP